MFVDPKKLARFIVVSCLAIILNTPCNTSADQNKPQKSVQSLLGLIQGIKTSKNLSANEQASNRKIVKQALALLDMEAVARKTLGKYWKKRSLKERKKFATLLSRLFANIAFPNSAKFFAGLKIFYLESETQKNAASVPVQATHQEEGEVEIIFMMQKGFNGRWQVVDVILEGVSMRNNLRSQFYRVIAKENYDGLIKRMIRRLGAAGKEVDG